MVDTISQPGCAECGAGGLVLTDYRPYAFLQALLELQKRLWMTNELPADNQIFIFIIIHWVHIGIV